jgi:DoxX-like family
LIGFAEVLGAAGLVLPMATGILPWLAPLAAVGLTIIVLMAAGFHLRADERLNALETGLWVSIAAVVAIGRWDLLAARVDVPRWVLAAAQEFHSTLDAAWDRSYSLDEAIRARVRRVYREQAEDVELYAEQLRRWQAGSLSLAQRHDVDHLAGKVEQWRSAVAAVLELADDLNDTSIEALLRKSELEVGLEALLGRELHGCRQRQR